MNRVRPPAHRSLISRVLRRKPGALRASLRRTGRVQELSRVFIKFGLSDWIHRVRLQRFFPAIRKLLAQRDGLRVPAELDRWERLRLALEELGPTFVKLGQLLSNRSDILPTELTAELASLQDRAQPVEWTTIRTSLESELGRDQSAVFRELDQQPAAAASIAQVHRGILLTGEEVAVKIQRPGIRATVEMDLDILTYVAGLAHRYVPATRILNPVGLAEEFRRHMMQELDFTRERRNMERFLANHKNRSDVHVPATYPEYSTERLLVMEFVHGTRVSSLHAHEGELDPKDCDPKVVAARVADLILEQILVHGFFHGDPHPGNILVLPGNAICFLDFGLMGHLSSSDRRSLVAAVSGLVRRDGARVTDAVLQITGADREAISPTLSSEIQGMVDEYTDRPLKDVNVAELLGDLIRTVVNHGLSVPSNLLTVAKALLTIEAVGLNIDPEFTSQPALEAAVRRLAAERLNPRRLTENGASMLFDYAMLLEDLPKDVADLVRQARTGELSMGFRLRNVEPLRRTLDDLGYRLIYGIVLGALMISSAIVIHAGLPPLWHGVPLIGVVGFGVAGILSLGVLFRLFVRVLKRDG
jgi:ubiquinone biosynthesis protein